MRNILVISNIPHYIGKVTAAVALMLVISCAASASVNRSFHDETLNYKVMFKWGIVNKQAGRASLGISTKGNDYHTVLTARSEHWADKFFKVRDTLSGVIDRRSFQPRIYTKVAHEGGDNKHDVVTYRYEGAKVIGLCTRKKWDDKGKLTRDEEHKIEAQGTTVDMLSSFYYMRALPYEEWKAGHVVTLNIFSGKRKELLTIKYLGTERIKTDGREYECYHIQFTFTGDDRKKTSDDMDAWISTDHQRIPIKMEGKLKVGKVQCFYTGSDAQ